MIESIKKFLDKHSNPLRGASAVVALLVIVYGASSDKIHELFDKPILEIHEFTVSDANQGGAITLNSVYTQRRDTCNLYTLFQYTDRSGQPHRLEFTDTASPKVSRAHFSTELNVPADAVVGSSEFFGLVRYSHPSDNTCNRSYIVFKTNIHIYEQGDTNRDGVVDENDDG